MTPTQLKEYFNRIDTLIDSTKTGYLRNSDREHNAAVMSRMLDKSRSICMYSGMGSVFSRGFLTNVGMEITPYSSLYVSTADVDTSGLPELLKKSVFDFLSDSGKSLTIIIQHKDEGVKRLKEGYIGDYIRKYGKPAANLEIYSLNDAKWYENAVKHFSYSDDGPNMARLETNAESHTAICSFHTAGEFLNNLKEAFHYLKANSTSVKIG